ncbi:MAG TPA: hypothetical protein VGF21_12185 [Thermoleophilaceae bacterium]
MSFDRLDPAGRPLRGLFAGAIILIVVLLGVFAYSLAHSQNQQRDDLEKRFRDRADISAAVTDAIFASAGSQGQLQNAAKFGGSKIDEAALEKTARQGQSAYAIVIADDGKVLAATPGSPKRTPANAPYVAKALRTGRLQLSDQLPGPGGKPVFESASPFPTTHGRRVLLQAASAKLLSQFLDGFLAEVPNVASATSYVVDSKGQIVGSTAKGVKSGQKLPDKDLAAAIEKGRSGSYDDGRYFAAAPVTGSTWSVVLSADKDNLYAPLDSTVPWLIFAAFALMAIAGLFLFWRVLMANSQLQRAELSRVHALEINDNVVQRLVVAKLALERGATETSREKLAETLQETQQLVTSLLEEKEIVPGVLRRSEEAPTDRPPGPNRTAERK